VSSYARGGKDSGKKRLKAKASSQFLGAANAKGKLHPEELVRPLETVNPCS